MRCGLFAGSCVLALLATPLPGALGEAACTPRTSAAAKSVPASCAERGDAQRASQKRRLRVDTQRSSRYAEDFPKQLTVFVSARKDRTLRRVRAKLVDPATGRLIAKGRARGGGSPVPVLLHVTNQHLVPGHYMLSLSAREQGRERRGLSERPMNFLSRTDAPPGPLYPPLAATPLPGPGNGAVVQQATVDWRASDFEGNDQDGFVVPGIGHGVLTCSPDTQWLRVFPADRARETTMMNWTFKDWESWSENAVRENVSPNGNDFNEGLNKFGPTPEKVSRGYFVGAITDRLGSGATGGKGRAPTTLRLTWQWDFNDPNDSRCFATATLISEPASGPTEAVSSVTVNWRGEENASASASDTAVIPGLGTVGLTCEAGPGGTRTLSIAPEPAVRPADFSLFEGSEMASASQDVGPYTQELPNNGMLTAELGDSRTLIASSRFKVNDPDGAHNFCHVAAQLTAG